jgi:hypothetical protein
VFEMAGLILDTPPSPWMLSVVGLVALILGLLIVIWPRKANEVIWRSNQAFRPWRVRKPRWMRTTRRNRNN